ncbi:LamG-like jellyroll fold domain-containing protein [Labrenzia sp. DG1229]|uniref:LamG-like jellyroll fold domain-containing protein n=1 Tax=Labrenzia sp. DG1229 TaxID=681847 RepID=UPI000A428909|nr:LamG-like jellyroll fold domain-containing protein [Labrenzia sp. DG1229]
MNRTAIVAVVAAVCCAVLIAVWLIPGQKNAHVTTPIEGAYVQLGFDGTINTIGEIDLHPQSVDGKAVFSAGQTGQAYFAQGDGRYLEIKTPDLVSLSERVDISFDIKAEDWTNPYEKSAPVKTVAVVSGKSGDRIRHVIFNLSNGEEPVLSVAVEDVTGSKARLTSDPGAMTLNWHQVRLVIDQASERTQLYLDGALVMETGIVPAVISHGMDRVKIGTWYRRNQAFRGLLDNFVIRDAMGEGV